MPANHTSLPAGDKFAVAIFVQFHLPLAHSRGSAGRLKIRRFDAIFVKNVTQIRVFATPNRMTGNPTAPDEQ